MRVRLYQPSDAPTLDRLLNGNDGDVRLDRDVIAVAVGPDDSPFATLAWRPCAYVHELRCGGLLSANALTNFAIGQGISRPWPISDISFLVDPANDAMLRFTRRLGATEQTGRLFTLRLR